MKRSDDTIMALRGRFFRGQSVSDGVSAAVSGHATKIIPSSENRCAMTYTQETEVPPRISGSRRGKSPPCQGGAGEVLSRPVVVSWKAQASAPWRNQGKRKTMGWMLRQGCSTTEHAVPFLKKPAARGSVSHRKAMTEAADWHRLMTAMIQLDSLLRTV